MRRDIARRITPITGYMDILSYTKRIVLSKNAFGKKLKSAIKMNAGCGAINRMVSVTADLEYGMDIRDRWSLHIGCPMS